MNRSISSAPSAGALVRICTWTLVTSGTASIGSLVIDQRPTPTSTTIDEDHDDSIVEGQIDECANHPIPPPSVR